MLEGIVAFILVLGVLIFFHELGHFLVARWAGVGVLKFSLGFGPKLWSWKGEETEYMVCAVPLGGYVKMLGEEDGEEVAEEDKARSFEKQSLSRRTAIVAAGPIANFLLAYVIFTGVLAMGLPLYVPQFESLMPTVDSVVEDSPAERGGLQPADKIIAIDGARIDTWHEMTEIVVESPERELAVDVERAGGVVSLLVTPRSVEAESQDGEPIIIGQIGITKDPGDVAIQSASPVHAIVDGAVATWRWAELMVIGIVKIVQGELSSKNIGGPILIADMSAQAASQGILNITLFIALISINLGIVNLLPVPVLDGGHLMFFAIEGIRGRPVEERGREIAHQIGLFLLLSLMTFAFYNDIMRYL
ncbi:MAG TPA: RIP metalloprotease RseP [Nitrospirales bacterium]|nr:RIP metalloprotease RseP [Nitrospirales bacterium]HIA13907.1 RIP metalloprotease RseP [Nitrospirales bacterium]HIB54585.1 RIP metalloprotease RseP [Nitrospirales bacterium]HIC04282.1 RIP metalloprotease RseP [Nitrospirales bacterium]HIN34067.1 RIP metalloprotease RseP [Nitrospirales bacterium]